MKRIFIFIIVLLLPTATVGGTCPLDLDFLNCTCDGPALAGGPIRIYEHRCREGIRREGICSCNTVRGQASMLFPGPGWREYMPEWLFGYQDGMVLCEDVDWRYVLCKYGVSQEWNDYHVRHIFFTAGHIPISVTGSCFGGICTCYVGLEGSLQESQSMSLSSCPPGFNCDIACYDRVVNDRQFACDVVSTGRH